MDCVLREIPIHFAKLVVSGLHTRTMIYAYSQYNPNMTPI